MLESYPTPGKCINGVSNSSFLNKSSDYAFVSFCTNIHELLRVIDEEYDGDYEDVDLRSLLAQRHPDDADLLSVSYTDVVLVFDCEPQDAGRSGSG